MISIKKVLSKLATDDSLTEKKTLLWTNSNPIIDFNPTTIDSRSSGWVGPSDLSQFDCIEIKYFADITNSTIATGWLYTMQSINIGGGGSRRDNLLAITPAQGNVYVCFREAYTSNSGITFGDGKYQYTNTTGTTNDNSLCIPVRIYGIKRVKGGGSN